MATNLKKFVNPRFTRTVALEPMRRLLERHRSALRGFDMKVFDGDAAAARQAIEAIFAGPEGDFPEGLVADLHRIAALGTRQGLDLLLAEGRRHGHRFRALARRRSGARGPQARRAHRLSQPPRDLRRRGRQARLLLEHGVRGVRCGRVRRSAAARRRQAGDVRACRRARSSRPTCTAASAASAGTRMPTRRSLR